MELAELERWNFSCELHDGILQHIIGARMHIEAMRHRLEEGQVPTLEALVEIESILQNAALAGRRWIGALRGDALYEQPSLVDAMPSLMAQSEPGWPEIFLTMNVNELKTLECPANVATAFYRIAQEAIRNAARHSQSNRIDVQLSIENGLNELVLVVKDYGRGFSPTHTPEEHFGLKIMQTRAQMIGAQFSIQSNPNTGTSVSVRWGIKTIQ